MTVNYLAVFVAALLPMALGFLWYSPMLFGKKWMKLKGYTEKSFKEAQSKMGLKYALSFVSLLLSALILSWVETIANSSTLISGASIGALMWVGFVTTTQLTAWIFSDSKKELYFIDTGYQLVSFLFMGAILGVWK